MNFWIAEQDLMWDGDFPRDNLGAMNASIAKWQAIVNWHALDADNPRPDGVGWVSCALCQLYLHGAACADCPVYDHTGYPYCQQTPFEAYSDDPSLENAQAELDFLKQVAEYVTQDNPQDQE